MGILEEHHSRVTDGKADQRIGVGEFGPTGRQGGAMPSPKFPATATLLDARQCPLDKFDALFAKITQERRIADGYFLHEHPDAALVLFVVNGSPYGAGRVAGQAC